MLFGDGLRVGIWGFGREGRSAFNLVRASAVSVVIAVDTLGSQEYPAENPRVSVAHGDDVAAALLTCDVIIVSPGIPAWHPVRAELVRKGVELTSVTDLWLRDHAVKCVGVTGTKGKSTTSAMVEHVLKRLGHDAEVAGNIGKPLLDVASDRGIVVAELGSYQCSTIRVSPRVAVVTNLYQDHLDWWGGDLVAYWTAKLRVASRGAEVLICDDATAEIARRLVDEADLPPIAIVSGRVAQGKRGRIELPIDRAPFSGFPAHMRQDALFALAAASWVADSDALYAAPDTLLADFRSLPFRLVTVAVNDGIQWVVDTLSTAAESTVAALDAFPDRELVLIVGGQERGIDYSRLDERLLATDGAIKLVGLPQNGARIAAAYGAAYPDAVRLVASMADAVSTARGLAQPGGVVVLSPAAPSYGSYRDYADKAADFVACLHALGIRG